MRPKIERYCLESFFLERNSWSSITARELCSHQCLWSGFIFPELEHLYKNVFAASFPKRSVRNVGCSFVSKKRTRSTVMYPPEWARISSRFISRVYLITQNRASITAREQYSRAVIPLPKKALQKISLDFCLKSWSCDRR